MIKNVKKCVPVLRFPEFSGDWKFKKLVDIADPNQRHSFTGGPFGSDLKSSDYTTDGIRVIQLQNIGDGYFLNDYKIFTSENKADQLISCNIYPNDILLSKMGDPVARACIVPDYHDRYVMCSDGIRLVVNQKLFNTYFIYSLINSYTFRKNAENASSGSTRKRIGLTQLRKLQLICPSLEEQEKIGKFLGECDRTLNLLRKKKELLETYKRGIMQKIFSQQIRFKNDDGSNFPNWEKKKLRNLCSLIKDGTHGTHQDYSEGQYFLLSAKNITNGQILYDENDRRISQKEFEFIYKNYQLKKNDILLTIVGTIGRLALFNNAKNLAFQRSVAFFRFKESLPMFMYHQMTNIKFQRELLKRKVVSAQPGIYLGDLSNIKLYSPNIKEQEKIAEFLTAIDQKIEAVGKQIEGMEKFKKGLLQKMFV